MSVEFPSRCVRARGDGVFFWVGSDVAICGMHPDLWKRYDQEVPFIQRIDTIIKWLSLPKEQRPMLVMGYYHEPDESGHEYGPNDPRTFTMCTKWIAW